MNGVDEAGGEGRVALQPAVGDQELQAGLLGLSRLVVGDLTVPELLSRVADLAVGVIPGADGVGVTLLDAGRPEAFGSSAAFVRDVDDVQYRLDQGPCVSAARQRRTMRTGSLGGEARWPRFGPRVGRLGVHSALSLPLLLAGDVVGTINVYAHAKNAFGEQAERLGELFAAPAAVAVRNAQVLDQARQLTGQLQAALSSRATIDQAIGILISRSGASPQQAFDLLRSRSQDDHTKLAVVAQRLLNEAAARARARRHAP